MDQGWLSLDLHLPSFLIGSLAGSTLCLLCILHTRPRPVPKAHLITMAMASRRHHQDEPWAPSRGSNLVCLEPCPHPTGGYRVVRFTVGLANLDDQPPTLFGQPIELCFHSDFDASTLRPLSIHFDRYSLMLYHDPPVLMAPVPPGVMVDLGRVDVLPDDPQLMELLQDQIQREMLAELERSGAPERLGPRLGRLALGWLWAAVQMAQAISVQAVTLCSLLCILVAWTVYPYGPMPGQFAARAMAKNQSIDNIIPIINHASAITLGPTLLCPILFFNPLFYLTISNGSDQAAVEPLTTPLRSLDESWNLTVTLIDDFISTRFSHEELKRYLASDHGPGASKRLANSALWIYNGLRKKDIMDTRSRGVMLHGRAKQLWSDIDFDVFIGWLQSIDLSYPFVKARLTQPYSPGQDLFIAPERDSVNYTTTSSPIPIQKLPKELPDSVRGYLDGYRNHLAEPMHFLGSSCTILQTCDDPRPHSAPDIQVIHPSCQIWHDHSSPEIMLKRLEQWAISARQRNLTWASTVMEADRLFSPNRVAEYFWPNQTAFPPILDQAMILAQFNDVISQTIQSADAIMMDDRWRRAGLLSRAEDWVKGVPADRTMENPEEAIHQLKMAQRHVTRQLRNVIQGLGEVYSICQKFADFSALLDGLYSPANWIVQEDRGKSRVRLKKLPHPRDQLADLTELREKLSGRWYVIHGYHELYKSWEHGQGEGGEGGEGGQGGQGGQGGDADE